MKFHFIAFVYLFLACSILRAEEFPKEIEEYGHINQEIEKNFKVNELTRFSLKKLDQNVADKAAGDQVTYSKKEMPK
jgi:hypothetical protein